MPEYCLTRYLGTFWTKGHTEEKEGAAETEKVKRVGLKWKSLYSVRRTWNTSPCQLHLRSGLLWGHHTFQYSVFVLDEWLSICTKSPQWCLTLCNPMNCGPSDSSVHGILQARMLACIAMLSSRGSSQPRDWTCVSYVSCIGRQILYLWCYLGSPW